MKQFIYLSAICVLALSACTKPFKKTADGTMYKIISTKKGATLVNGNTMEINVVTKYNDSLLGSTYEEGMPQLSMYDTANFPAPYKEIFKNLHVGDSIVIKMPTDSIIAKSQGQSAPFMKKGQFINQYFTITNVYTTPQQVDSVQKMYMALKAKNDSIAAITQIAKDSKIIDEYLAKNKITTVKAEKGTYVQILEPGTGTLTDSSVLMVNYTGTPLGGGAAFDSNTDSSFQHVEPYPVNLRSPEVIPGWVDGLKLLRKGAKAKFYVPSSLAYGKRGNGQMIKPNANLSFDIQVVDIITQAQFAALIKKKQQEQMAQQMMMQQLQQQQQQQQGGK
jgi:FKBP-type peptidyl-prolyl cis-trans isomerase FkpA